MDGIEALQVLYNHFIRSSNTAAHAALGLYATSCTPPVGAPALEQLAQVMGVRRVALAGVAVAIAIAAVMLTGVSSCGGSHRKVEKQLEGLLSCLTPTG
jgi:hypothetical protein